MEVDHEVEYKYWPHPAETVTIGEVASDRSSQTEENNKKELEQLFSKEASWWKKSSTN